MIALAGCSGGPVIDLYAADYRVTEASAGDAQLLLNILRAKDNLPIHFSDLSLIHGSIQWTAAAGASIPVAQNGSFTPTLVSPVAGMQNAPTFDVGTLDTQEFTRGMLKPVELDIIGQLFDQGVDARLIMLLFFSEFRTLKGDRFLNNMACDPTTVGRNRELGCLNHVYGYLGGVDKLFIGKELKANIYDGLRPVGGWLSGTWALVNLSDLRQIDPTKHKLIGKQLYSIERRLTICYKGPGNTWLPLIGGGGAGVDSCNKKEVILRRESPSGLYVRSAYEILQFLGQVLRFQEERGNNRCLTLGGDPTQRHCDTGEVLFQVNAPTGRPVIGTMYGGGWYALYDRPCNKTLQQHCDYSLQVLAIVELLLNYNKAAKDIVTLPRVQAVQ
jgi:hypothetical protein